MARFIQITVLVVVALAASSLGQGQDLGTNYNTGDSSRQETVGPDGEVRGQYSYVDGSGVTRTVRYRAGKDGYMVEDPKAQQAPAQNQINTPYNHQQHQPTYQGPQQQQQQQNLPASTFQSNGQSNFNNFGFQQQQQQPQPQQYQQQYQPQPQQYNQQQNLPVPQLPQLQQFQQQQQQPQQYQQQPQQFSQQNNGFNPGFNFNQPAPVQQYNPNQYNGNSNNNGKVKVNVAQNLQGFNYNIEA